MQSSKDNKFNYLKLIFESGKRGEDQTLIADLFPALVYVYDAESRKITFFNKKFQEILGVSEKDLKEKYNSDLLNLIHIADREAVRYELGKFNFLKDDDSFSYTARFQLETHPVKYFKTEGMVLTRNEKGNASSFLFIGQDISNEVSDHLESDALKSLFRETEELLHFGIWNYSPDDNRLEWSEGMYTLLEYPGPMPLSVSNELYTGLISENDRERVESSVKKAIEEKSGFQIEYTLNTFKGNRKIVSTNGKCIFNDAQQLVKIIGVTRDITKESLKHKELLDYRQSVLSKERFLASGSWEYDIVNNTIFWSEGKYRLFGYDIDQTDPLPPVTEELFARHLIGPTWKGLNDKWSDILSHPQEHIWEYEIRSVDGQKKVLESYANIIHDANGKPIKILGATRDITRIREYEESLKKKIQELDRSNKELEEFAYIASHDLQEPLRKITAFSERLKEKAANELSPESTLYLDRMLLGAANMRLLIDNLLEFSRTSRHNNNFATVDINQILKVVEAELELKIEETGATIIAGKLPLMEGIPSQIQQLFTNLLGNAIKFRQAGQPPEIRISCEVCSDVDKQFHNLNKEKTYYKIIVKDNGIGFEQEYATRIFQIFQRLHGKSEYPGSGIGLAICKKIVDNHQGRIFADSQVGQGARFTIILPESQPR